MFPARKASIRRFRPKTIWGRVAWQSGAILVLSLVMALAVNGLRPGGIPLVADRSPVGEAGSEGGRTRLVSLAEAERLYRNGEAVFLDARPAADFDAGHIQGALCLPAQAFDAHFPEVLPSLAEDATFIAYCDGEHCSLSHDLATLLEEMGFADVRVLVNGWSLWRGNGLPVESGT